MAIYIDGKIKVRIYIKNPSDEEEIENIKADTFVSCPYELVDEDYQYELVDECLDGTIKVRVKIQDPYTDEDIEDMKENTFVTCPNKTSNEEYEYEVSDAD